jgi:localization factor PodJL
MKLGVPWTSRGQKRPNRSAPNDDAETASVHARLDDLARQLEQLSRITIGNTRPAPAPSASAGAAHIEPQPQRHPDRRAEGSGPEPALPPREVHRYAGDRTLNRNPLRPVYSQASLDQAMAEIVARQRALDAVQRAPQWRAPDASAAPTPSYIPEPAPSPEPAPASSPVLEPSPAPRPSPAAAPAQNLSSLEEQLRRITTQIESLRRPCAAEDSLPVLQQELSDMSRVLADAAPRRAIEAIEAEVRGLSARIDQSRFLTADAPVLANLEHSLAEIRDGLRGSKPTEILVAIQNAIQSLNTKIDGINTSRQDPAVLQQLESAIGGLRGVIAHVASDDTLARLTEEVRGIAEQIEHNAGASPSPGALTNIERHIGTIAEAIEQIQPQDRNAPARLEALIRGLADKIEKQQPNPGDTIAFGQLEDRIARLAEKLDASGLQQLEPAIAGLRGIIAQVASDDTLARLTEEVRGIAEQIENNAGAPPSPGALTNIERHIGTLAETIEQIQPQDRNAPARLESLVRGLADKIEKLEPNRGDTIAFGQLEDRIARLVDRLDASGSRFSQLESIERGLTDVLVHFEEQGARAGALRTSNVDPAVGSLKHDLEAVNGTLSRLVDRLTTLESGIRASSLKPATASAPPPAAPAAAKPEAAAPTAAVPPPAPPAEQRPAPAPPPIPPAAEPASGDGHTATSMAPPAVDVPPPPEPSDLKTPSKAPAAPEAPFAAPSERLAAAAQAQRPSLPRERPPIDPNLPPDHPIEPGAVATRGATSPADRIAASEAALESGKAPAASTSDSRSDFLAAARRAAQAASQAQAESADASDEASEGTSLSDRLKGRVRSMIVGAGVVILTLGAAGVTMLLVEPNSISVPATKQSATAPEILPPPKATARILPDPTNTGSTGRPFAGAQGHGIMTAPPADAPAADSSNSSGSHVAAGTPSQDAQPSQPAQSDITGAIPTTPAPAWLGNSAAVPLPPSIPQGAGQSPAEPNPRLAAAAAAGDPAAAYELAVRHIEGRGVPRSYEDAARWLAQASKDGLAPAQFRLGSLYEKGMGVKKDLKAARRLYAAAAEKGNAKAMHNLAVLHAEGIDGKPDYKTAIEWFRKGADRGVADSQYNLGVLYARGVGLDQNLAESYKWFALAARGGDQEAGRKRDEIGALLDADSLMAARLATKTWTAKPQPKEATTVAVPPGGWDQPQSTLPAKRRARDAAPVKLGPS